MAPICMVKIDQIVKRHKDGAIINLFVNPGAESITFPAGFNKWRNCIKIKVRSPAKDNKANKEVIKTVADYFEKSVNDVFVLTGVKNLKKTVFVKGVTVNFISERLKESLNGL